MVVDLIKVYGGIAVGVWALYGHQCPMCVGVFVLGASEEGDSDVNIWMRFSKARKLRAHIHWMEREDDEGRRGGVGFADGTHGTGGRNCRLRRGVMLGRRV